MALNRKLGFNCNALDSAAVPQFKHRIKVTCLPEDRVLTIKVGLGSMAEEKLTAAGVLAGVGH